MDRKFWLDLLFVALLAALAALLLWVFGELGMSGAADVKQIASPALLVCGLLALLVAFGTWRTRHRAMDRRLAAWAATMQGGATGKCGKPDAGLSNSVSEALRSRYGWRWRYRLPWLLLTGDAATIGRLSPELAERGWLLTDDALLLWSKPGPDGVPDKTWLHRIRRMRRARPIDAIVLTLDDASLSADSTHGGSPSGVYLASIEHTLRWSAPIYVLDLAGTDPVHPADTVVTGCECSAPTNAPAIEAALLELRDRLAHVSVEQLARNRDDGYAAELSARLDTRSAPLARWMAGLSGWQRRPLPVAGVFFAPRFAAGTSASGTDGAPPSPLWRYLADAARRTPGRRKATHPITVLSAVLLGAVGVWSAGMLMSGLTNARELALANDAVRASSRPGDASTRLRALLALQQRIEFHEARVQRPALLSRFGLNHDRDVLAALWKPYAREARSQLVVPVQQDIEAQLVDLVQIPAAQLDDPASRLARDGHAALKTYLMMAEPTRADPAFMTPQLVRHWHGGAGLSPGEKRDLSQRLLTFYARHLDAHTDWRIAPRDELVGGARQTLLAAIGVKNSEDTIYQALVESVGHKFPSQTLASLTAGTDTRGLLRSAASVPGAFTRQAWEGTIEAAIDHAAKRNGASADWVLGMAAAGAGPSSTTPDALRTALRARYFADYAEHWQSFMNGIACDPARTLPAAVAQLKLIADSRQSPVIALMKSLDYQGGAGAERTSLSDTLVNKAQNLFADKNGAPQTASADPAGPLGASFGPLLRLVAPANASASGAASDLSLQRYTERISMLRLKLQQIADSPDADSEARQVAQSLFQGKRSELADTLAYARLVAASLGEQWAGMGQALFVQPVAQATRAVLEPAQASLDEAWRRTVVATWNHSFAGRYPFANTANDASLPELARFLRPQGGLIGTFLSTQLAGMLTLQGDQWVPASSGSGAGRAAGTIDPAFLAAINLLQRMAGHLLAQGEPRYAFELKPVPVSGVTDTRLTIDGQTLHYYNQQEVWQTLTWPSSEPQKAGARLEWQTERAGTNLDLEFGGRWALVRMLERARVTPVDGATFQLTWQAPSAADARQRAANAANAAVADDHDALNPQGPLTPASSSLTYPLAYLMRTDVGKGPLDLLALRGFVLPSRIFVPQAGTARAGARAAAVPPPLPPGALAAARHAVASIPGGPLPQ